MITLGYIFGFILLTLFVVTALFFLIILALGSMHEHLKKRGEGFGRDEDLHAKLDRIIMTSNEDYPRH